jgi:hypothetical protein
MYFTLGPASVNVIALRFGKCFNNLSLSLLNSIPLHEFVYSFTVDIGVGSTFSHHKYNLMNFCAGMDMCFYSWAHLVGHGVLSYFNVRALNLLKF